MSEGPSPGNPYLGPRPFEATDADRRRFFGRRRETAEIVSWLTGHRLVLLYAQSGAGKTSLFNAAVWPALEALDYEVLPPVRVTGAAPSAALDANPYVQTALAGLDAGPAAADGLAAALDALPRGTDRRGRPRPRVVVFDQLEELFGDRRDAAERFREEFFDQLATAIEADGLLRVMLVMREEYLAELDPYHLRVPDGFKVRFRLERLDAAGAEEAILRPVEGTGRTYEPEAVSYLVRELTAVRSARDGLPIAGQGRHVEPVQLQVVCFGLWEALPPDVTVIGADDVARLGDVTERLGDYYEEAIAEVAAQETIDAGSLRRWIREELITPAGTRSAVPKGNGMTGRVRAIPTDGVDALVARHVVRQEERSGLIWYELTHDRLVEPIVERNTAWERARRATLGSPLEAPAQAWVELGRDPGALLQGRPLQRAQDWADLHPDDVSPVEREFLDASQESDHHRSAVELRRSKRATRVWVVVSLALVGLLVAAVAQTWRVRQKERQATAGSLAATSQALFNAGERLDLPLLLAVAAAGEDETLETRLSLVQSASTQPRRYAFVDGALLALDTAGDVVAATGVEQTDEGDFVPVVRAWAASDLSPRLRVEIENPFPGTVAMSAAGTLLAFPSDGEGSIGVVDIVTDDRFDLPAVEPGDLLGGHAGDVVALAFSPTGERWLASAALDGAAAGGTVVVWDLDSRAPTFTPLDQAAAALAFSPDGARLAVATGEAEVRVFDAFSGELLDVDPGDAPGDRLNVVAFGPGGELAAGSRDGRVYLWPDTALGARTVLRETGSSVEDLAFVGGDDQLVGVGDQLALATGDGFVELVPVAGGEAQARRGHRVGTTVGGVGVSTDGRALFSASQDGSILDWPVAAAGFGDALAELRECPEPSGIALGWWDESVYAATCQGFASPGRGAAPLPDTPAAAAGWASDGSLVAVASGGRIDVVDVTDGAVRSLPETASRVAVAEDGTVVWTTRDGRVVRVTADDRRSEAPDPVSEPTAVAISHDGDLVAVGVADGTTYVWPDGLDEAPKVVEGAVPGSAVRQLVVSDGTVVTAGPAGTVQLIDVTSGEPATVLFGHRTVAEAVAVSRDGELLATGGGDGAIVLWDVATGTRLGALTGADSAVWSLAFGDGDVLAAATGSGAVLRWDLSFAGLVDAVCERGVQAEEWPSYFDGVPGPCTSGG